MTGPEEIRQEFRRMLAQRPDIGAAKILLYGLFEPSSRFDPRARRRWRPGVIIAFTYILLLAAAWCAFN